MNRIKFGLTYQHYKTKKLYAPLQLVIDADNGSDEEPVVLYYSLQEGRLYVRHLEEWAGTVDEAGKVQRFAPVGAPK